MSMSHHRRYDPKLTNNVAQFVLCLFRLLINTCNAVILLSILPGPARYRRGEEHRSVKRERAVGAVSGVHAGFARM